MTTGQVGLSTMNHRGTSRRGSRGSRIVSILGVALASVAGGQVITEFAIPNFITAIASGPDGNLWFAGGDRIGRITPAGVALTEFTVPGTGSIQGIAAGPDGNLWFTNNGYVRAQDAAIGRITPAGVITEFTIPQPAPELGDIAAGPDHSLWFTERNDNKIGRITTGGLITEFTLPRICHSFLPSCLPEHIVAGPDGSMWFIEEGGATIGRIATTGDITEFTGRGAVSLATGPDGNLWFTEGANGIGRMTTGGAISEFGLTSTMTSPGEIIAGPDGNLWFVESSFIETRIARITTAGVVTEFPVSTSGENTLARIAVGPDGNLWFTEPHVDFSGVAGANKIGRITTAPAGPCAIDATTLCLNRGRFRVQASWRAPSQGTSGDATAIPLTSDTGYFWFFSAGNIELIVKVLDGCSINQRYWVFAGGLTDAEVTLTVEDSPTLRVQTYSNPDGVAFQPIQDTSAFATCP